MNKIADIGDLFHLSVNLLYLVWGVECTHFSILWENKYEFRYTLSILHTFRSLVAC